MKKRHYIQLIILLVISFAYVSLKTGFIRSETTLIEEPRVTIFTASSIESHYLGKDLPNKTNLYKSGYAEISYRDSTIKLDRSDYGSDEDFKSAIEESKIKIKENLAEPAG